MWVSLDPRQKLIVDTEQDIYVLNLVALHVFPSHRVSAHALDPQFMTLMLDLRPDTHRLGEVIELVAGESELPLRCQHKV